MYNNQFSINFDEFLKKLSISKAGYSNEKYKKLKSTFHSDNPKMSRINKGIIHYSLDLEEHLDNNIPMKPERIYGSPGSKTSDVLLMKAAKMHLNYPNLKIAIVFLTRSSYQRNIILLDKYLRQYSKGKVGYNYNEKSNIDLLHGWGSKSKIGFYKKMFNHSVNKEKDNIDYIYSSHPKVRGLEPVSSLNKACDLLLKSKNIEPYYDAIFIDQAEDFVVTEDNGVKTRFFDLIHQSTKPNKISNEDKLIIWSAQYKLNLKNNIISNDSANNIHVKTSSTPHSIRKIANKITNANYKVHTDFNHPIENDWKGNSVMFKKYKNRKHEINALAKNIEKNIDRDKMNLTHDIMIIILGDNEQIDNIKKSINITFNRKNINVYFPRYISDPDFFYRDKHVTASSLNRAKGYRRSLVYIVGLDYIADNPSTSNYNQLLTAINSSDGWVHISGTGNHILYDKLSNIINEVEGNKTFSYKLSC